MSAGVNERCHYATREELDYLRGLARALPGGAQVVMLGAGPGVMLMAVLEGNRDLRAAVVDHERTDYALRHLEQAGLPAGNVAFQVCDSAQAGREWRGGAVHLLIVDADHSAAGVSADLEAWAGHVTPGGWVFCHDYDAEGTEFADQERYPGVKQAVDAFVARAGWRLAARVGTAACVRRPE